MRRHVLAMSFAAYLVACGGGGGTNPTGTPNTPGGPNVPGTPAPPAAPNQVQVQDNQYTPASVTVTTGTTVTWTWATGNYGAHSVTFADGDNSGAKVSGTHQRTFSNAGTFAYQCSVHGASMSGTVVVTAP